MADQPQFQDVQAPLTRFVLAHKGLRNSKPRGQIRLCQPSLDACLAKQSPEPIMLV
jgi:hypothetical protein